MPTPAEYKFDAAFAKALELEPDVAPGPTQLNTLLYGVPRHHRYNQLNGRQSKRRRELLLEAGFVKDPETGRWVKQ